MKERHHPREADSSPGHDGPILTDTRRQDMEERRSPPEDVYVCSPPNIENNNNLFQAELASSADASTHDAGRSKRRGSMPAGPLRLGRSLL